MTEPHSPALPADRIVETQHTLTLANTTISYTATAGTLVLREEARKADDGTAEGEQPRASIFFVAYTRTDADAGSQRPITFAFNGGPGSSSVWLHMGLLGPRRTPMAPDGGPPAPPYQVVDNLHTLLDETDLVFIDPMSTGFSRPTPGINPRTYHGFKKDLELVGDFIRLYTSRYGRWMSPKYLIGESYGTTRAGGLAGYLQDRHGMFLNGLMLVSAVLNFGTLEFDPSNDLPYLLFLPTYAATAFYHQRLEPALQADLTATLTEVEQFAQGEYAHALFLGTRLPAERRAAVAAQLARYTGLPADYIERSNLRIRDDRFVKELLRTQGQTVGRLDSRFVGVDRDAVGERHEYDPSYAAILGAYTATLNAYLRNELQFTSDLPYEILTGQVWPWSYSDHENRYVDVSETLRKAMAQNPYLRVHVASGYYDLATPYFATTYTLNHLSLPPERAANIRESFYPAGHMMYIHDDSLAHLKAALRRFIRGEE
jgi:carboxypeptidase C (cathepsin A)